MGEVVGLPALLLVTGRRRRGSRLFLLQLHWVLLDGAPPADAPSQPQAPHAAAAAAAATGTGAAERHLPATTPGNNRHIRRKRKRRKRRVRRTEEEQQAARTWWLVAKRDLKIKKAPEILQNVCKTWGISLVKRKVKSPLRKRRRFPGSFEDSLQISSVWGRCEVGHERRKRKRKNHKWSSQFFSEALQKLQGLITKKD